MHIKTTLYTSLLCSFFVIHCMETTVASITDNSLQKLITSVNESSLNMVDMVKRHIEHIEYTPKNMSLVLRLNQEQIDSLFLANVQDDDLRPLFLSMGANIKACTPEERNCLWDVEKPAILKELLEKGAEVDKTDDKQKTPLINLLDWQRGEAAIEGAAVLLEYKANPNIKIECWGSLLHRVVDYSNAALRLKAAQLLCKYKADVNAHNTHKHTPLCMAVAKGDADLVELFLPTATKEEINAPNYYQECLLHVAMEKDSGFYYYSHNAKKIIPEIVFLLLEYGADPNISYSDGKTMPLHVAVDRGQTDIIKKLIEYKALKHYKDKNHETAYMIAKNRGYKQDILDLLYVDTIIKDSEGEDVVVVTNERNSDEINVGIEYSSNSRMCIIQ